MTKTRAVLNMELYLMLSYIKTIFLMVAIMLVISVIMDNASFLQVIMMVYLMVFVGSPFAVSEKAGTDKLYASLGVGRGMVVAGRYMSTLAFALVMLVLSNLVPWLLSVVLGMAFDPAESLMVTCVMLAILLVLAGIQLPVYYKYGYTSARFLSYVPMLVLFAVVMLADRLIERDMAPALTRFMAWLDVYYVQFAALLLAAGLAVYAVSGVISGRIYAGKDL